MNKNPLITAHMGDCDNFPQNTLIAFEMAIFKGADTIEIDVHESKDGHAIVHHDFYLERRSNGKGFVGNFDLEEIRKLDAGSWFDKKYSTEKIPLLKEVLDLDNDNVRFEIELKSPSISLVKQVLNILRIEGKVEKSEITCQHRLLHSIIKNELPLIRTGLFLYPLPEWMDEKLGIEHIVNYLEIAQSQVAHLGLPLAKPAIIRKIQLAGYEVHISCNESLDQLEKSLQAGANQVSTNYLDAALTIKETLSNQP